MTVAVDPHLTAELVSGRFRAIWCALSTMRKDAASTSLTASRWVIRPMKRLAKRSTRTANTSKGETLARRLEDGALDDADYEKTVAVDRHQVHLSLRKL